jgi:hypothetical protein
LRFVRRTEEPRDGRGAGATRPRGERARRRLRGLARSDAADAARHLGQCRRLGDASGPRSTHRCPWLIRRFINPRAEFVYVPASRVLTVAADTGATPYDIDGVEFTHEGERCSFDTILRIYDLGIPALDRLALIVRGADTSRHDLAPQCGGLFAISLGLSGNFPTITRCCARHGDLRRALTWCRSLQAET